MLGFSNRLRADDDDTAFFSFQNDGKSLSIFDGNLLVLKFNYAFLDHTNVPKDEPRRFAGDYIYPLNGIHGENLLDDAPEDHFHHHGVFWTWPRVLVYENDSSTKFFDLWTSNTLIRQRFLNFNKVEFINNCAVVDVENGWFIGRGAIIPDEELDPSKLGEKIVDNEKYYGEKIVEENVCLIVHPISEFEGVKFRAIDFKLSLTPTKKDISLQGAEHKSYGGLTIRFRPEGEIGITRFITTDEGIAKGDMPLKNLRWADYTSKFFEGELKSGEQCLSGAAIFLAPNFPSFPPTWLTRYYGPLCVGFPGVIGHRLKTGKTIIMEARIWIHGGLVSKELLKKAYEKYFSEK